jgi:hypothetical protein
MIRRNCPFAGDWCDSIHPSATKGRVQGGKSCCRERRQEFHSERRRIDQRGAQAEREGSVGCFGWWKYRPLGSPFRYLISLTLEIAIEIHLPLR